MTDAFVSADQFLLSEARLLERAERYAPAVLERMAATAG